MRKLACFLACGLVFGAALAAPPAADARSGRDPSDLRPSRPVICGRNDEVVLRDRHISTDGHGVEADGNCEVLIVGSLIEAGGVGVLAQGNAEIRIRDSFVSGGRGALVAENRAEIRFRDSTIRGGTRVRSLAEIIDEGDNDISDRADRRSAPPAGGDVSVEIGPGGVRIDTEGETVMVGEDSVEVGREGVVITPEGVVSEDAAVEIGPGGVQVTTDYETILVGDGFVRIEEAGGVTEISGDWRAAGASYSAVATEHLMEELGATVVEGLLQVQMAGDVLFDFDSVGIRAAAARELEKVAQLVRARSAGTVYVIGHTDSIGETAYNQKLSEARALAVMRWLNQHENIPVSLMAGKGMGETQPVAHNTMPDGSDNPDGRRRNRRVDIKFEVDDR